jgi:uncharacterized lipoprotein
MRHSRLLRTAVLAALVLSVFAVSGCRWFKRGNPYNQSAETRPLEVPPDLDRPNTDAALGAPASVTRSSMAGTPGQPQGGAAAPASAAPSAQAPAAAAAAAPAAAGGFTIAGTRDEVFNKLGEALAAVPGVTVASKAQLLGAYDVSYEGSNFLVRVNEVDGGVYVSAVDPRGVAASGEAATKLIAALKTALGG